jgi:hypothetical protein
MSEMAIGPRSDLTADPSVAGPSDQARAEFAHLASQETLLAAADALGRHGIPATVVRSRTGSTRGGAVAAADRGSPPMHTNRESAGNGSTDPSDDTIRVWAA